MFHFLMLLFRLNEYADEVDNPNEHALAKSCVVIAAIILGVALLGGLVVLASC